jgi:hypothetical protein
LTEINPLIEEVQILRKALEQLHNCTLRMCCHIREGVGDNPSSTKEVVHVLRKDWNRAFDEIIVPPYNRLYWETDLP